MRGIRMARKLNPAEQAKRNDFLLQVQEMVQQTVCNEMNTNERISALLQELGSYGVVVEIDTEVDVRIIVQENFIPPEDLSQKETTELDKMFTTEDHKFLREISKGLS